MKKKLGLVGRNISYSFSQSYFTNKFNRLLLNDFSYNLFDIEAITKIVDIFSIENLLGFNVTIPYKEHIIPYLDILSDEAKEIGAVNCVKIENGIKMGYNTDAYGFEKSMLLHKKKSQNKALILGDGGAAKAVKYVLDRHQIGYQSVFRNSTQLNFENLTAELVKEYHIIIQCTPVGTFPNVEDFVPFPFEALGKHHLVIDLIYNPNFSKFLTQAAERKATTMNGYYMLEQQAEKAWEIWKS